VKIISLGISKSNCRFNERVLESIVFKKFINHTCHYSDIIIFLSMDALNWYIGLRILLEVTYSL